MIAMKTFGKSCDFILGIISRNQKIYFQVFSVCSGEIDPAIVDGLTDLNTFLESVKFNYGVTASADSTSGKITLCGSMIQLMAAQWLLDHVCREQEYKPHRAWLGLERQRAEDLGNDQPLSKVVNGFQQSGDHLDTNIFGSTFGAEEEDRALKTLPGANPVSNHDFMMQSLPAMHLDLQRDHRRDQSPLDMDERLHSGRASSRQSLRGSQASLPSAEPAITENEKGELCSQKDESPFSKSEQFVDQMFKSSDHAANIRSLGGSPVPKDDIETASFRSLPGTRKLGRHQYVIDTHTDRPRHTFDQETVQRYLRDIEHTYFFTNLSVLFNHAGKLNWHDKPGKLNHFCPQIDMYII